MASTSTRTPRLSKQLKAYEKEQLLQEKRLCKKIKLANSRQPTYYDGLWGHIFSLGPGSSNFEYFEAREEAIIVDVHPESIQLQEHLKNQGEKMIEFHFTEEGKQALADLYKC